MNLTVGRGFVVGPDDADFGGGGPGLATNFGEGLELDEPTGPRLEGDSLLLFALLERALLDRLAKLLPVGTDVELAVLDRPVNLVILARQVGETLDRGGRR